jgi:hypothetical protein
VLTHETRQPRLQVKPALGGQTEEGASVGLFDKVLKRFQPLSTEDPVFGRLTYMHIKQDPSKSYWEAEYVFPPTGTVVSAGLQGNEDGPVPEARDFYLRMQERFEGIMETVMPILDQVFQEWLGRPLSADPWADIEFAGFDVDDPTEHPCKWGVMFETTGEKWLGITVPFVGEEVQPAVVDT